VAQIFYVHCPACGGKFPCHPELWQVEYDLLCPFCQHSFPQEMSPLIITMTGERRAGSLAGAAARHDGKPDEPDPSAAAESM
jgi:hypothetical protein